MLILIASYYFKFQKTSNMKKIYLFILLCSIFACNQAPNEQSKSVNSSNKETEKTQTLCNFMVSEVSVNDTGNFNYSSGSIDETGKWSPSDVSISYSKNNGFNQGQIKNLKETLIKDTAIRILRTLNSEPVSKQEAQAFLNCCDSIPEIDASGNPTGKVNFMCDSTNLERELRKILFYEALYFNKSKGSYEKRILGYTFLFFKPDNSAGEMYHVFMNDEALSNVRNNLSIRTKKVSPIKLK